MSKKATFVIYEPLVTKEDKRLVKGPIAYYSDVDDTLAMGNLSDYDASEHIIINYTNGPITVVPNKKMINLLVLFYKLGYPIIVWSKTGGDWAKAVSEAIGIDQYVSAYLPKPTYYGDDLPAEQWMGTRRYREPDKKGDKNETC